MLLKKIIRLSFELLFLSFMLFILVWNELVIYGLSQAKGQLSMIWDSKPIEKVLQDPSVSDSLKQKLILVTEIKKFAVDSLGINPSTNYTNFYNQHNQSVLIAVSACEPYSFKQKEWTFPFLGTVSYKGFFDKSKARKEIGELRAMGYDIDVYSPSGWSTLGWFNDPVLSGMLAKGDGSLSNLIIHELTHGTLYVKDNVTFNENLASFIGDKGAEKFLVFKFGKNSKQFIEYEQNKTDEKIYSGYILNQIERLDSLYSSYTNKDTEEFKKQKKNELITQIVLGVNRLPLNKKSRYFNYSLQAFYEKNAFCMAFQRYDSQQEIFEKEFKELYHSDLKMYLDALKKKYPSL